MFLLEGKKTKKIPATRTRTRNLQMADNTTVCRATNCAIAGCEV